MYAPFCISYIGDNMLIDDKKITIIGKNRCNIYGVKAVIKYTDDCLNVSFGKYSAQFLGTGFSIEELTEDGLVLTGTIISMGFADE